jgi:hypothetical protein
VYADSISMPPYFVGLSVTLGYMTFDVGGIFYGPILFCFANTVWNLVTELTGKEVDKDKDI